MTCDPAHSSFLPWRNRSLITYAFCFEECSGCVPCHMVSQEITEEGIQVESLGRTKWNCKVLGVDGWRYPLRKKKRAGMFVRCLQERTRLEQWVYLHPSVMPKIVHDRHWHDFVSGSQDLVWKNMS
jgi:hypothetical protein